MFEVLIVEDDVDLRSVVALFLEDSGYRTRTASDGSEALVRVEESMPDVILLDMRMRGMNGWAFAEAFRARYGRAAPIVVVTAATDAKARAAEIDADAWLGKPFDIEALLAVVERFTKVAAAR